MPYGFRAIDRMPLGYRDVPLVGSRGAGGYPRGVRPLGYGALRQVPGGGGIVRRERQWNVRGFGEELPGVGLNDVESFPVTLNWSAAATAVKGAHVGPLPGPLVVRSLWFKTTESLSGAGQDALLRVDFAQVPGLDPFTFVVSTHPVEPSSAPYSLFSFSADWFGSGATGPGGRGGWLDVRPIGSTDHFSLDGLDFVVPLGGVYVKAYYQNDSAATVQQVLILVVSPISGRRVRLQEGRLVVPGASAVVPELGPGLPLGPDGEI